MSDENVPSPEGSQQIDALRREALQHEFVGIHLGVLSILAALLGSTREIPEDFCGLFGKGGENVFCRYSCCVHIEEEFDVARAEVAEAGCHYIVAVDAFESGLALVHGRSEIGVDVGVRRGGEGVRKREVTIADRYKLVTGCDEGCGGRGCCCSVVFVVAVATAHFRANVWGVGSEYFV